MRLSLVWCAGASRDLLAKCPEVDTLRQSILGTFVLLTGALATLSSFYAFYSVSSNLAFSAACALLWGSLIFTLDRLIVSSMRVVRRKDGVYTLPVYHALPRLFLSALIGLTLGVPLELYIFRPEITELLTKHQESEDRQARNRDSSQLGIDHDSALKRCDREHRPEIANLDLAIESYRKRIQSTTLGQDGTRETCGRVCVDLNKQMAPIAAERQAAIKKWDVCVREALVSVNAAAAQAELDRAAAKTRQQENNARPSVLAQSPHHGPEAVDKPLDTVGGVEVGDVEWAEEGPTQRKAIAQHSVDVVDIAIAFANQM